MTTLDAEITEALRRCEARGLRVTRADKAAGTFDAIVVTYGTLDTYDTTFAPGVFRESLKTRMPVLAWAHAWDQPIGRAVSVVRDDDKVLELTFRLDDGDAVPLAKQAWAQLKSGTLDEVSVGFFPDEVREVTMDGRKVLEFVSAELDEVSLVLRGAVPGAVVTSTKDLRTRAAGMLARGGGAVGVVPAPSLTVVRTDAQLVADGRNIADTVLAEYAAAVRTGATGSRFIALRDAREMLASAAAVGLLDARGAGSARTELGDDDYRAAGYDVDDEIDAALERHPAYTVQRADGGDVPDDAELDAAIAVARAAAAR